MTTDITLIGMNTDLPAVRRLMAVAMYAKGIPLKNIQADTGIQLSSLARLARTYGVPQRRPAVRRKQNVG